jgi:hypothetical protein
MITGEACSQTAWRPEQGEPPLPGHVASSGDGQWGGPRHSTSRVMLRHLTMGSGVAPTTPPPGSIQDVTTSSEWLNSAPHVRRHSSSCRCRTTPDGGEPGAEQGGEGRNPSPPSRLTTRSGVAGRIGLGPGPIQPLEPTHPSRRGCSTAGWRGGGGGAN